MMKFIFKIFFVICFLVSSDIFAQRYFTKTYTVEDGLPTRAVYDVIQDSAGYMWFATEKGISRYDGFRWENFDNKNGLPGNSYGRLIIDEKKILWAAPLTISDSIVYFLDNQWHKIKPVQDEENKYQISSFDVIYEGDNAMICVSTLGGIYLYYNNQWQHTHVSNEPEKNSANKVISKDGIFYIASRNGLFTLNKNKLDSSLNSKLKSVSADIISIRFENKNTNDEKLWVLGRNWLGYLQNGTFLLFSNTFQLPVFAGFEFSFMEFDKRNRIYFGNSSKKYFIDRSTKEVTPLTIRNGFSSDGSTSLFIDREENIWVTDTRGIDKMNNSNFVNYFEIHGLLDNEVTAVCEADDGRIIFGHNNGLSIFNGNKFKRIEFSDHNFNTKRVLDITRDNKGTIWFTSSNIGVGKLDNTDNIKWYSLGKGIYTTSIIQDGAGKIWAATQKGLYYLENDKFVKFEGNNKIRTTYRKLFTADEGRIYLTGQNGISLINGDKIELINSSENQKGNNTYSYYKSTEDLEFVGTSDGLYKIENGKLIKFIKNGFEINNPVYFIMQCKKDNYWFGTDDGVVKWNGENKTEIFNTRNGLAGRETNRSAGFVTQKEISGLARISVCRDVYRKTIRKIQFLKLNFFSPKIIRGKNIH